MYKVASDRRQTSLHRGTVADWVNGEERLTAAQRLEQMKEGVRILEDRCKSAIGDERKRLGIEKLALQHELTAFKKAMGMVNLARRDFPDLFRDVAREMLPKKQYEMIYNAAVREYDTRTKAANDAMQAVMALTPTHYEGEHDK
jgi:hypothetical protein